MKRLKDPEVRFWSKNTTSARTSGTIAGDVVGVVAIQCFGMLKAVAIANYRSLRHIVIRLQNLNVLTGANGSGKSSFYRALRLLADTAQGRVVSSLAREGGLQSTLWAGPESVARSVRRGEHAVEGTRRQHAVNLRLGFASDDLGYLIDLGLPKPSTSAFALDPEIKRECLTA